MTFKKIIVTKEIAISDGISKERFFEKLDKQTPYVYLSASNCQVVC